MSLAAKAECEEVLGEYVLEYLTRQDITTLPTLTSLEKKFDTHKKEERAYIEVKQHELGKYDELLTLQIPMFKEVSYA